MLVEPVAMVGFVNVLFCFLGSWRVAAWVSVHGSSGEPLVRARACGHTSGQTGAWARVLVQGSGGEPLIHVKARGRE